MKRPANKLVAVLLGLITIAVFVLLSCWARWFLLFPPGAFASDPQPRVWLAMISLYWLVSALLAGKLSAGRVAFLFPDGLLGPLSLLVVISYALANGFWDSYEVAKNQVSEL